MNRVLVLVIRLLVALVVCGSASRAADGDATAGKADESTGAIEAWVGPVRDNLAFAFHGVMPPVTRGLGAVEDLIGDAYYYGHWVTRDYAAAARWYRRAAASGNALAQGTLGDMYYYGRDVPQDFASAARWWQLAADQGVALAQLNLSVLYANGDGVEQDYVKSHMYANLAAAQLPPGDDHAIASKNRDIIAKAMTPAQLAEAQRLAREWRPKQTD
jgi:TPR repeat protein